MARGRRPTDEVRREVLAAAGELLLEVGMARFTIEGVAARSGASKTTIYKLWPSKGALALDGYFAAVEPALRFPNTGDLESDLRTQMRSFVHLIRDTTAGTVIAELIGQAQLDPALKQALLASYTGPRRALAVERILAGQAAGQVRADLDAESLVDQLWGACYHRWLLPNQPITDEFADDLVQNLFRGVTSADRRSRRRSESGR
jgi:AcrR family transcriptional regulator